MAGGHFVFNVPAITSIFEKNTIALSSKEQFSRKKHIKHKKIKQYVVKCDSPSR